MKMIQLIVVKNIMITQLILVIIMMVVIQMVDLALLNVVVQMTNQAGAMTTVLTAKMAQVRIVLTMTMLTANHVLLARNAMKLWMLWIMVMDSS